MEVFVWWNPVGLASYLSSSDLLSHLKVLRTEGHNRPVTQKQVQGNLCGNKRLVKPYWCFYKALLCLFTSLLCKQNPKRRRTGPFCANNCIHLMKRRSESSLYKKLCAEPHTDAGHNRRWRTCQSIAVSLPWLTDVLMCVRQRETERIKGTVCFKETWITSLCVNKPEWHQEHKESEHTYCTVSTRLLKLAICTYSKIIPYD